MLEPNDESEIGFIIIGADFPAASAGAGQMLNGCGDGDSVILASTRPISGANLADAAASMSILPGTNWETMPGISVIVAY